MERRIIIAGAGGQGILFFGKLIAYAAMLEGKEVTWFPSYGAEIRGGTANCTVLISDEMIGSPVIKEADFLVAMNEASCAKYMERLVPGGTLIYDSSLAKPSIQRKDIKVYPVPASELSAELGNTGSANMALTGSLSAISQIAGLDSIFSALDNITPARRKKMTETNKNIIKRGFSLAQNP
jgi:2-oxoglutarate ferredoxin oxidoreductase subunit gamma